jgi:hypothetical protein
MQNSNDNSSAVLVVKTLESSEKAASAVRFQFELL